VHATDLADVLEEDGRGAQHQDGHLRTGGRWGERRGEEEEEGAEEQCLRERGGVYEGGDEEGQREGARDEAGDGGEGPDGGHHRVPGGRCRVHPLLCCSRAFSGPEDGEICRPEP